MCSGSFVRFKFVKLEKKKQKQKVNLETFCSLSLAQGSSLSKDEERVTDSAWEREMERERLCGIFMN